MNASSAGRSDRGDRGKQHSHEPDHISYRNRYSNQPEAGGQQGTRPAHLLQAHASGLPYRGLAVGVFALLAGFNLYLCVDALRHGDRWPSDYTLGGVQWGARQLFGTVVPALMAANPAAPVYLSPNWANGTGPWYANWGDVARAMGLPTTAASGAALDSGYPDSPTAYWGNLMPALSYAVDHGAAGAGDAWSRITAASNFTMLVNGFNDQPVWGTKPRTR